MSNSHLVNLTTFSIPIKQIELTELVPSQVISRAEAFFIVQTLRGAFPPKLFLLDNRRILILTSEADLIIDSLKKLDKDEELSWPLHLKGLSFQAGSMQIIDLFDPESAQYSRMFLAELIAISLREEGMIVQQTSMNAFQATFVRNVENVGPVELWPGFEFRIFIDRQTAYLLLDPKHRMNKGCSLRSDLESSLLSLGDLKGEWVKDICSIRNCGERTDPYHRCALSGPGKTLTVVDILDVSPDHEFDTINYLDLIRCPTQMLRNSIQLKKPCILAKESSRQLASNYPLERLASIPSLQKIKERGSRDISRELMRKIQPAPHKRFALTESYLHRFQSLLVDGIETIGLSELPEIPFQDERLYRIRARDFVFFNTVLGKRASEMWDKKPFYVGYSDTICYVSELNNENLEKTILRNLIRGFDSFRGLQELFNIEAISTTKIDWEAVPNLDKRTCVVVLIPDESKNEEYQEKKFSLLSKEVYVQKMTVSNFLALDNDGKRANYLKNITLGWLSKSGYIPFLVNEKSEDRIICIGWKTSFKRSFQGRSRQTRVILTAYVSNGTFLRSRIFTTERDYATKCTGAISSLIESSIRGTGIRTVHLHRDGDFLSKIDIPVISELKKSLLNTKLVFVSITDSILRVYRHVYTEKGLRVGRPHTGTVLKITEKRYGLITTELPPKEQYRTPQSIMCQFEDELEANDFNRSLEVIFQLSQCYHGYVVARTKFPATIHAAKRIHDIIDHFELSSSYNVENDTEFFV